MGQVFSIHQTGIQVLLSKYQ